MIFIKSDNNDVYFNLAMEEYIFNKFKEEDVFIIWVNSPSVIVGKHQNLLEEVNLKYCYENNINIARRISGGGTVFHDLGNLNYSYITNSTGNTGVDFKEFIKPIYNLLKNLEINVDISPRNDLRIDDFKICGHAEYMRNKRVLHHGCILFNSNLEILRNSLKVENFKIESSAVKSVRSKVCNIFEKLEKKLTFSEFLSSIEFEIFRYFKNLKKYKFLDEDLIKITEIANTKYKTDEWIYGLSPNCSISFNNIYIEISNGKISKFENLNEKKSETELVGKYYKYINIKNIYI